jgi:hypothetical protein
MVRTLQALTVLALISAGVVFVLCAGQWLQGASASEQFEGSLGSPVLERFRQASPAKAGNGQQTHSALVRQAESFALYLNPPQRPKAHEAPAPKRISKQTIPATIAAKVTPKFRLIGTSYYHARPEESMALVSEPGSGTRWVKQGERLGHFVLEKVERGTIVYRQGDRLREMAVDTKAPNDIAVARQTKPASEQTTLASEQTSTRPSRRSRPLKPSTRPRKPLHRLGPSRPGIRTVAYNDET